MSCNSVFSWSKFRYTIDAKWTIIYCLLQYMVGIYIACMLLQEVFTWGDEYRIARSGDHRVPGRVSDIPSGETIIKVSCNARWPIEQTSDHWANGRKV